MLLITLWHMIVLATPADCAVMYSHTPHCHMVPQSVWNTSAAQGDTKPLGAWYKAERQSTGRTIAVFAARQLLQPPDSIAGQNE